MLEYYLPGLDASLLDDKAWINKMAWLLKIRIMEREEILLKNFESLINE
jgi:hypothetical protein